MGNERPRGAIGLTPPWREGLGGAGAGRRTEREGVENFLDTAASKPVWALVSRVLILKKKMEVGHSSS